MSEEVRLRKEMDMAVDPDPLPTLEDQFEEAKRTGRDETAGLISKPFSKGRNTAEPPHVRGGWVTSESYKGGDLQSFF